MRAFNCSIRRRLLPITFVLALLAAPASVFAQQEGPNVVWSVAKSVLVDPTTYTPAALSYASQRMDWGTSQVLFDAGWLEHNHRYTLSGRADDVPLGYEAGLRQIRRDALGQLQYSVVNNVAAQVFERALSQAHPEHRKLFKTLSWIERISFSAYVGYLASSNHFQQASRNRELARIYGLP